MEEQSEASKAMDKYTGKEEFAYLTQSGFSSEAFKIEIKNLPKYYGYGEVRNLLQSTLSLECNKIKIPRKNSSFGFFCFRSEEDRQKALTTINGYKWKGNVLKAIPANPAHDPLVKKRRQEQNEGNNKRHKTAAESSEPLGDLPYEEQLAIKEKKIAEILEEFKVELRKANVFQGKLDSEDMKDPVYEVKPIIPSPLTEGYRNKCEFTIGKNANDEIEVGNRVGSYTSGSVQVASIDGLKMPPAKMKKTAKLFCEFVKKSNLPVYNPATYEGYWRQLAIRLHNKDTAMMLIIGIHPQNLSDDEKNKLQSEIVEFFKNSSELDISSIYYEEIQKRQSGQKENVIKHIYGTTHVHDYIHGLKFQISPSSFFQGNTLAAGELYREIIDLARPDEKTTVLDVCCGTGTIGLCFAKHCKDVYGMEIIPQAIEDAKVNAQENGIGNAHFKAGSADDLIYSMVREANVGKDGSIVAVVDPPRAGLPFKSIQQLRNSVKIDRVVYVSCSPQQAVKNFVDLCKNCSKTMKGDPFVPKVVRAVDMFPHTNHCELVMLFERVRDTDEEANKIPGNEDKSEASETQNVTEN